MAKYIFVNRFFYPDYSATSQILTDLTLYLSGYEMDIHVVTSRLSYDKLAVKLPVKEKVHNITVHRVWSSNFGRTNIVGRAIDYLTFYLSAILRLLLLVKRDDLLITKTDPPLMSIFTTLIAKIHSAKAINWLQDLFPEVAIHLDVNFLKGRLGRVLIYLRNYSLRKAFSNVVLGEKMRDRLIKEGVSQSKIEIIQNWSVNQQIAPEGDHQLRTQWGLDGKFVIGYSGNLGRAHDSQTIINAMLALKDSQEIVFLFIGGGSHYVKVEQACERYNISNAVFKPYQPYSELHLSLAAADVHWLCLQPKLEGLIVPSKFYGIAAAGKPVIFIGDTEGEVATLINDRKMGFVVPFGDSQALLEKFNYLALNRSLCQQMGQNNRKIFEREFDSRFAFHAWKKVLEKVESKSAVVTYPKVEKAN